MGVFQLPYRWSVPLIITSGLLHWLLSQSIFLVRFEERDLEGRLYPTSTCSCGYSPLAFLVFSLLLWALLITVFALMLRKVDIRVPIAAHCSQVISAACHPPPTDVNCARSKIKWGVVENRFGGTIGHCTFSSEEVADPEEWTVYS
jgi:hypothetical protein